MEFSAPDCLFVILSEKSVLLVLFSINRCKNHRVFLFICLICSASLFCSIRIFFHDSLRNCIFFLPSDDHLNLFLIQPVTNDQHWPTFKMCVYVRKLQKMQPTTSSIIPHSIWIFYSLAKFQKWKIPKMPFHLHPIINPFIHLSNWYNSFIIIWPASDYDNSFSSPTRFYFTICSRWSSKQTSIHVLIYTKIGAGSDSCKKSISLSLSSPYDQSIINCPFIFPMFYQNMFLLY